MKEAYTMALYVTITLLAALMLLVHDAAAPPTANPSTQRGEEVTGAGARGAARPRDTAGA